MSAQAEEAQWYAAHGCTHAHCEYGCEHPQPFMDGADLLCGRCWFIERARADGAVRAGAMSRVKGAEGWSQTSI